MKTFQKKEITEVKAIRYGFDKLAEKFVKLCIKSLKGEINEVPGDMLGTPKNAFNAVKTSSGWSEIQVGDWIVEDQSKLVVVPNGVFELFFKEV